jgi:hypothetical protein
VEGHSRPFEFLLPVPGAVLQSELADSFHGPFILPGLNEQDPLPFLGEYIDSGLDTLAGQDQTPIHRLTLGAGWYKGSIGFHIRKFAARWSWRNRLCQLTNKSSPTKISRRAGALILSETKGHQWTKRKNRGTSFVPKSVVMRKEWRTDAVPKLTRVLYDES